MPLISVRNYVNKLISIAIEGIIYQFFGIVLIIFEVLRNGSKTSQFNSRAQIWGILRTLLGSVDTLTVDDLNYCVIV